MARKVRRTRRSTKRHKKHRQSRKTRKASRKRSMKGGFNVRQWIQMWDGENWDIHGLGPAGYTWPPGTANQLGDSNGVLTPAGFHAEAAAPNTPEHKRYLDYLQGVAEIEQARAFATYQHPGAADAYQQKQNALLRGQRVFDGGHNPKPGGAGLPDLITASTTARDRRKDVQQWYDANRGGGNARARASHAREIVEQGKLIGELHRLNDEAVAAAYTAQRDIVGGHEAAYVAPPFANPAFGSSGGRSSGGGGGRGVLKIVKASTQKSQVVQTSNRDRRQAMKKAQQAEKAKKRTAAVAARKARKAAKEAAAATAAAAAAAAAAAPPPPVAWLVPQVGSWADTVWEQDAAAAEAAAGHNDANDANSGGGGGNYGGYKRKTCRKRRRKTRRKRRRKTCRKRKRRKGRTKRRRVRRKTRKN